MLLLISPIILSKPIHLTMYLTLLRTLAFTAASTGAVVLMLTSATFKRNLDSELDTDGRPDKEQPRVFRLGSGSVVTPEPSVVQIHGNLRRLQQVDDATPGGEPPVNAKRLIPEPPAFPLEYLLQATLFFGILAILTMMMPGHRHHGPTPRMGHGGGDFNYRVPPGWSPESERDYSFRAYMTDISIWIMLTDLQPHQQCAAIIMKLGGSAREMARMISPQEMMQGGIQAGVMVDPVTYLLTALHLRYSPLEEESRITTMSEMLAFSRLPGEGINSLLARYETVRQRAAIEGQFVMSVEGCSLQILRACGIGPQHLPLLLQPFMGQLPRTDAQFQAMCTSLRRFGHITEGTPGNIAAGLQGFTRQARLGAYHGVEQQPTQDTFFGNLQTNQAPQDPYGETQPQALDAVSQDPFVLWGAAPQQGERQAPETWDNAGAFPVGEEPSGTDTDTSSDDGEEADDGGPDISRMSNVEAAEALFGHYRKGKRQWRRFTGKPVRKFRRFVKKSFFGKGKGKGKGKRRSFMYTADDVVYLLKGKGKGNHQHTSGKGFGRGKNPKDRSGNTLKCRICQSEDHFQAACPQRSGSQGIGGFSGLTLPEGSSSSGGRQASETGRGQHAPPWNDEEMFYDAPRDIYMTYEGQEADPWHAGQDPWRRDQSGGGRRTPPYQPP